MAPGRADSEDAADDDPGRARYVFAVRFRLEPSASAVSVEPATFETTLSRAADPPGTAGWRFFRDNLWHGELNAPDHFRELTEEALGVPVAHVEFRGLRTDEAYLSALREAVADDLEAFRASSVDEALSKYLGSSVHVVDGE